MPNISRRTALAGTAAVAASAALPAQAALLETPVRRRYSEWLASEDAFKAVLKRLAVVQTDFFAAVRKRSLEHDGDDYGKLEREMGLDEIEDAETRTCDQSGDAYRRLIQTPAESSPDVLLKLKAAVEYQPDDADEIIDPLLRDLERLAGRAS